MKKNFVISFVVYLLLNLSNLNSTIAQTTDHCLDCLPDAETNDVTLQVAARYIEAFQSRFTVLSYGGTIYSTDSSYFKNRQNKIPYASRLLKFHFGYNPKNNDLFICFENAKCIKSNFSSALISSTYLKSSDINFGKLNIPQQSNFKDVLQADQRTPQVDAANPINQTYLLDDLQISKEAFRLYNNNSLPELFPCDYDQGAFIYKNIITSIYKTAATNHTPCYGIRYYFGWDDTQGIVNRLRVILVGVDANGRNLSEWRETSDPAWFLQQLNKKDAPKKK